MLAEDHAWYQPSKIQASIMGYSWFLHCVCVLQTQAHLPEAGDSYSPPAACQNQHSPSWGSHKHHHLFSQYHQHHSYYLESSCHLQLHHHFCWPGEDAGVQACAPFSNQISPFLHEIITAIFQQHCDYTLLQMKDWHPKRRNAQDLFLLSYHFVFLCVSLLTVIAIKSFIFPIRPIFLLFSFGQISLQLQTPAFGQNDVQLPYLIPSKPGEEGCRFSCCCYLCTGQCLQPTALISCGYWEWLAPSGDPELPVPIKISPSLPHSRMTACF